MNKKNYGIEDDTLEHRAVISILIQDIISRLVERARKHDLSKLEEPEKSIFDQFTPRELSKEYMSDEYKANLKQLEVALDHHYKYNRHHPEHFKNGINDMNLIDMIEMLADFKSAGMRHADGTMLSSLLKSRERFGISDQLFLILLNTADELGWLEDGTIRLAKTEARQLKMLLTK